MNSRLGGESKDIERRRSTIDLIVPLRDLERKVDQNHLDIQEHARVDGAATKEVLSAVHETRDNQIEQTARVETSIGHIKVSIDKIQTQNEQSIANEAKHSQSIESLRVQSDEHYSNHDKMSTRVTGLETKVGGVAALGTNFWTSKNAKYLIWLGIIIIIAIAALAGERLLVDGGLKLPK